ncbi:MAG: (d)CMP kinase [Candidatus Poseidoniales archaeon]|jgi:cytidylate kinase|tara:strand:- start:2829 stop:3377 length:549 start_codon:yes stop_codon:yes gene_type:complete
MEVIPLLKVTISGPPGSGTSTLVSKLSKSRNWSYVNGGDVFRSAAKKKGISIEEFSALCKLDLEVDRSLDSDLREIMTSSKPPEILESRLSGWWAQDLNLDCKKIWIAVSDEVRAKRIQNREGGDFPSSLIKTRNRQRDDMDRYMDLYGIDLDDMSPYDLILEADDKDEEEVFQLVDQYLEE